MAQPLNYVNPRTVGRPVPGEPEPTAAIPIEFDFVLTRSVDHAGVRLIEAKLRLNEIEFFRVEDRTPAKRIIQLFIRTVDRERAAVIAGEVFARRKRARSSLGQDRPPETWEPGDRVNVSALWP